MATRHPSEVNQVPKFKRTRLSVTSRRESEKATRASLPKCGTLIACPTEPSDLLSCAQPFGDEPKPSFRGLEGVITRSRGQGEALYISREHKKQKPGVSSPKDWLLVLRGSIHAWGRLDLYSKPCYGVNSSSCVPKALSIRAKWQSELRTKVLRILSSIRSV